MPVLQGNICRQNIHMCKISKPIKTPHVNYIIVNVESFEDIGLSLFHIYDNWENSLVLISDIGERTKL